MERLLNELQLPTNAPLLASLRSAYESSRHDVELFASVSLELLKELPLFEQLVHQQLSASRVAVRR